jgi:hypothetical protein
MDPGTLATLKSRLVGDKSFSGVWDYFLTNFAENPAFMAEGARTEISFLQGLLQVVAGQLFPGGAELDNLLTIRLGEHGFVHGGCTVNGRLLNFFYFEDIQTGMLAVVMGFSPPDTKMVRFSGRMMPRPPGEPSVN